MVYIPPSVNALRRKARGAATGYAIGQNRWRWGAPGNTTRAGAAPRVLHPFTPAPASSPAATDPAATPPPAPPPDPVSYGQQSNISNLEAQRAGLSGIYNPQREALYAEGSRGLLDQGYFDVASPVADAADPATGAVSYHLMTGSDGRMYRQAFQQSGSAYNSRGAFDSSERMRTQVDQRRDITNARDAVLRSLASRQGDITRQQTSDYTNLSGQIGTAQGDYADWRASQEVPPAPPASEGVAPSAPAAAAGQARWRAKPRGFPTVKRGGWYYRA